jgi:hypothetical protein
MDRNQLEAIFLKAMGRIHVQGLIDAPPDCSCLHVFRGQAHNHFTGVAANIATKPFPLLLRDKLVSLKLHGSCVPWSLLWQVQLVMSSVTFLAAKAFAAAKKSIV